MKVAFSESYGRNGAHLGAGCSLLQQMLVPLSLASPLGRCRMTAPTLGENSWETFVNSDRRNSRNGTTISIDNALLTVWRNTNAIAVAPTGSFYPTWIDAYRGN